MHQQPPRSVSASSVEQAFQPAFDEISRRSAAGRQLSGPRDFSEPTFFPPSLSTPSCEAGDAILSQQRWVLFSLGTNVLAPRPVDPTHPSARIYGAFAEKEDALEHAEVVRERDSACSLAVAKVGDWILLPTNEEVRDDAALAARRADEKLRAYADARARERADFEDVVAQRRERDRARADAEADAEEREEERDALKAVYAAPKRLRAGAEVRGQGCAALCVLPDEGGEAMIRVLGCFETTIEADRWCQDVGSRSVVDHDILVVPTCEWFFPNGKGKVSSRERFRIDELQRIMDAAAQNPEAVRSYKEWKREQDRLAEERDEERRKEEESRRGSECIDPDVGGHDDGGCHASDDAG